MKPYFWILVLHVTVLGSSLISLAADFSLRETILDLKQVDIDQALQRDALGYPRLDASKLNRDSPAIITKRHRAIVLENRWQRVTLLPEMGRVYSLVCRVTGQEQLWTNSVAKPLTGQSNELGWWMIWGGIEYTLPRGEHGTTWALPWQYAIAENTSRRKSVKMTVLEPATRLAEVLEISIFPDSLFFEARITITNRNTEPVRFSHWTNPMWAPGGRGEITANTEFIVPCSAMRIADKPFNQWMRGYHDPNFRLSPLRWASNWRDIGDLLVEELTDGFYSAFCHEANEGVVRVFDPNITPGMDIWTWGFPPPRQRQREYSLTPNLGYVEMWGGTARDFSDNALGTLAAGQTIEWTEWMYAYHGTSGLTYANSAAAVFFELDAAKQHLNLAIFPARSLQACRISVQLAEKTLFKMRANLKPSKIIRKKLRLDAKTNWDQQLPVLRIESTEIQSVVVETKAQIRNQNRPTETNAR